MSRLDSDYPHASQSPGLMLWRVTNAWQRAIRSALSPFDLTHVQFVLLAALAHADPDEPMTQRDLADAASTDPMMTSQVVRALERNGLVARGAHPQDRRAVTVTPTPAGLAIVNRAVRAVEQTDRAYFAALGAEQDRFTRMLGLLERNRGHD
ncbi:MULTISPECIES: MarR family transcriptional regulator [unclassified Leucobacter]|uniref:MarR family winged helix-turn-helix transcriptional regulator n=1 Tax=unclassified Leucobacter TaxID=2621730 RepID=UPI001F52B590|nr:MULTISPECIES: MarR family transcriptional regulator [unclassified Leucobacter]